MINLSHRNEELKKCFKLQKKFKLAVYADETHISFIHNLGRRWLSVAPIHKN